MSFVPSILGTNNNYIERHSSLVRSTFSYIYLKTCLRHFVLKVIWQGIIGNFRMLISKKLFTRHDFGIFIIKLATKAKWPWFLFVLCRRHFMLKVIWQVIKGNSIVLISKKKNIVTGRNFGILIHKLATKQNGSHFHNFCHITHLLSVMKGLKCFLYLYLVCWRLQKLMMPSKLVIVGLAAILNFKWPP